MKNIINTGNDYAEYRILADNETGISTPYGYCVCENGDDTVSISTRRLQAAPMIVSDTYGYGIGLTDEINLPIAVAGRVLAYPYEARNTYVVGDCVCSGPDGKVSKMTRDEIKEYPDRIIGIVCSIPEYETWGNAEIQVNGRIWIKIK